MLKFKKKAFGDVVSTLIMFIAIISVTTGLVIAFQNYFVKTQSSLKFKQDLSEKKLRTKVDISHVFYNKSSYDLEIYLKNIGSVEVLTSNFEIFLNQKFSNNLSVFLAENNEEILVLQPKKTAKIVYNKKLNLGSHTVKIVTENGESANEYFQVS